MAAVIRSSRISVKETFAQPPAKVISQPEGGELAKSLAINQLRSASLASAAWTSPRKITAERIALGTPRILKCICAALSKPEQYKLLKNNPFLLHSRYPLHRVDDALKAEAICKQLSLQKPNIDAHLIEQDLEYATPLERAFATKNYAVFFTYVRKVHDLEKCLSSLINSESFAELDAATARELIQLLYQKDGVFFFKNFANIMGKRTEAEVAPYFDIFDSLCQVIATASMEEIEILLQTPYVQKLLNTTDKQGFIYALIRGRCFSYSDAMLAKKFLDDHLKTFFEPDLLAALLIANGILAKLTLIFNSPSGAQVKTEYLAPYNPVQHDSVFLFQFLMEEFACRGNLKGLDWTFEKIKNTGLLPREDSIVRAFKRAIHMNQLQAVKKIGCAFELLPIASVLLKEGSALIDLCLEMGYPKICSVLPVPMTPSQIKQRKELEKALTEASQRLEILPPQPANKDHFNVHGGDANKVVYEESYREAVGYATHYLKKPGASARQLLRNLGLRRLHMVLLGKSPHALYGMLADRVVQTPYEKSTYKQYGDYIRKRYADRLPLTVQTKIKDVTVDLSSFTVEKWVHPYKNRVIVEEEVGHLFDQLNRKFYFNNPEGHQQIIQEMGHVYWLASHFPIFCRGEPTIVAILVDGLLNKKFAATIDKEALQKQGLELNCEALCREDSQNFIEEIMQKVTLIQARKG